MQISKQQILDAIDTEMELGTLVPGHWLLKSDDNTCTVCAVGAVLRHATSLEDKNIPGVAWDCARNAGVNVSLSPERIVEWLAQGRWLNVLSCTYEKQGVEAARQVVIKHFPEMVTLDHWLVKDKLP